MLIILYLILEIQVGSRQQGEQARQIGGNLCPQIRFDERLNGQRLRFGAPCSEHLSPSSFPTSAKAILSAKVFTFFTSFMS